MYALAHILVLIMHDDNAPEEVHFEALPFIRKHVPQFSGTHYRVYTDEKSYQRVQADSALEAIKKSGIEKIFRIERDTIYINTIVEIPAMMDEQATGEVMIENGNSAPVTSDVAAAMQTEATPSVQADAVLSGSEVDQLLNDSNGAVNGAV